MGDEDGSGEGRSADDIVRALATGGGVLLLGFALEVGLSFVAKVVMARVLGRVDYGSVSIGIVIAANVSTVVLLGLDVGVARFLPRRPDAAFRRGVLRAAYRVAMPLGVLAGAGIFLLADPIATQVLTDPSLAPVVRVFAVAIPLATLLKVSVGAIRGNQRATQKALVRNVTQPVTRFGLIIVALGLGFGSLGVAWAYVGAYAAAGGLALYFVLRHTELLEAVTPTPVSRDLFSFSAPLAVTSVATLIVSGIGIDSVMLAYFTTTGAVGDYNVVYPMANLTIVVFSAFSFLFMPLLSELHSEGRTNEMGRLLQVVTKWLFLGTLPLVLGLILVPSRVISITFGQAYVGAAPSLSVLAVGFFVHSVLGANRGVLESAGRTRLIMLDSLAAALVNVVLNLLLIPPLGVLGAAIATTLAYLTLNLAYVVQGYRTLGVQPFTGSLLKPAAVAVVLVVGTFTTISAVTQLTNLLLFAVLPPLGVVYVVVILRFGGIEREELMLVLSFEERFGVDIGPLKRAAKWLMD
jgi:O-antigen/teichoic acid export membrane protein